MTKLNSRQKLDSKGAIMNKPNPQRAYDQRNGLISKSFKLPKTVVDDFANACKSNNRAQATELTEFMKEYISKTERGNENVNVF